MYVLNNPTTITDAAEKKFQKNNPKCTLDHTVVFENKNNLINALVEQQNKLLDSINQTGDIFGTINHNKVIHYKLMQVNILLKNISKLDINGDFNCNVLAELNSQLNIVSDRKNNFTSCFELLFGYIIKEEQWEFYNNIVNTFRENKNEIFQLSMGKGKSSVIIPLLCSYFNTNKTKNNINNIYIIVPNHLLLQTQNSLNIMIDLFQLEIKIISDCVAKQNIIDNNFKNNDIMIFDEIDYQYDPIKSIYNVVTGPQETVFDESDVNLIFDKIDKIASKHPNEKLDSIISNELQCGCHSINETYGMSRLDIIDEDGYFNRCIIPYERKDSPLEKSNYSSIILSLILTIQYFYDLNFNIEDRDFANLLECIIEKKHGSEYFIPLFNIDLDINRVFQMISLKEQFNKLVDKKTVVKKYIIYIILPKLTFSNEISNCSFIDVMNFDCLWKTAFSGTVNVNFKYFDGCTFSDVDKKFIKINEDSDEKLSVEYAIKGDYQNSRTENTNTIFSLENANRIKSVYDHLDNNENKYNCLIDVEGVFKDINNRTVVEEIQKFEKYQDYHFIYLDNNDTICYFNKNSKKYANTFVFFSQRNIIGIDIKNQSLNWRGLVLTSDRSTYTNVAQGIFRMRKLNKGQIIDIMYFSNGSNSMINDKIKFLDQIKNNEMDGINYKDRFLDLQILKFQLRDKYNQVSQQNKYKQTSMKPFYLESTRISIEDKMKKQLGPIYNKKMINEFLTKYKEDLEDIIGGISSNENQKTNIKQKLKQKLKQNINNNQTFDMKIKNDFVYTKRYDCMINENNVDDLCIKLNDNLYILYDVFTLINLGKFYLLKINEKFVLINQNCYYNTNVYPMYDLKGNCVNCYLQDLLIQYALIETQNFIETIELPQWSGLLQKILSQDIIIKTEFDQLPSIYKEWLLFLKKAHEYKNFDDLEFSSQETNALDAELNRILDNSQRVYIVNCLNIKEKIFNTNA